MFRINPFNAGIRLTEKQRVFTYHEKIGWLCFKSMFQLERAPDLSEILAVINSLCNLRPSRESRKACL